MMLTILPIEFDLEHFWNLESVGPDDSSDDSVLDRYSTSCVTRDHDGTYTARFLWKPHHCK